MNERVAFLMNVEVGTTAQAEKDYSLTVLFLVDLVFMCLNMNSVYEIFI